MFYKYREHAFDTFVTRIEYKDGAMIVYDEAPAEPKKELLMEDDVLKRFPIEMCKTEEDKKALLAFRACSDAVVWLHEVLKYVLKGESSEVGEVNLMPKNTKRPTVGITNGVDTGAYIPHCILRVTLINNGGQFAVDLSSAQLRFHEPITVWNEYIQQRVHQFLHDECFGSGRAVMRTPRYRDPNDFHTEWVRLVDSLSEKASGWLLESIKGWADENILVSKLLNLPQKEYEHQMKGLINHVDGKLAEQVRVLKSKCQEQKKIELAKRAKNAKWKCVLLNDPQKKEDSIFGDARIVYLG